MISILVEVKSKIAEIVQKENISNIVRTSGKWFAPHCVTGDSPCKVMLKLSRKMTKMGYQHVQFS